MKGLEIVEDTAPDEVKDAEGQFKGKCNFSLKPEHVLPPRPMRSGVPMKKLFGAIKEVFTLLSNFGLEGTINLQVEFGKVEHSGRITTYDQTARAGFRYCWAEILDMARELSSFPMHPAGEPYSFSFKYEQTLIMRPTGNPDQPTPAGAEQFN
jgi:hypothetical protein